MDAVRTEENKIARRKRARQEGEEKRKARARARIKKNRPHAFTKDFYRLREYKMRKKSYAIAAIIDCIQEKTIAIKFPEVYSPLWYEFRTYSELEKESGAKRQTIHSALKIIEADGVIICRGPKHKRAVAFNPKIFDITRAQMERWGIDVDEMKPATHWRIRLEKKITLIWDHRKGSPFKKEKKQPKAKARRKDEDPRNPSRKVLRVQPDGSTKAVWI